MRPSLIIFLLLSIVGCSDQGVRPAFVHQKKLYERKEFENQQATKFYHDYDIFERAGIDELKGDKLYTPFFAVSSSSDTTTLVRLFDSASILKFILPTSTQIISTFHDISDGPRYIFAKIQGDEIIRYGYNVDPYKNNGLVLPKSIEIISGDTVLTFFEQCWEKSTKSIMPFTLSLNRDCLNCLVHYHSNVANSKALHYYRNAESMDNTSRQNPGGGLYGFRKRFKYWRDYHNLARLQ